ncbi:hypothetical protein L1049_010708 [Liquidambar formosana]|uniref:Uncharacterized protein n=1 Tax=Liquidambar formosana TaxID=63359 RepID=A0AAP0NAQ5_LIQFO
MIGSDDLKSHDERESDKSEVSSPACHDQYNQHNPFKEEEKMDTSSVRSFVDENSSMEGAPSGGNGTQKIVAEDDGVVEIARELKSDKDSESKTGHDGSSSSSSSDDESQVVEKNIVVSELVKTDEGAYNPVSEGAPLDDSVKLVLSLSEEAACIRDDAVAGKNCNLVLETIPVVDSVKEVVSLSEEVIHVTESAPVENLVNSDVAELGSKESVEKLLPSLDENGVVSSAVADLVSKQNEDKVLPFLDETAGTSSGTIGLALKDNEDKLLQSSNAPSIEIGNGAEHTKDYEIPESSENQPLVASAPRPVETTSWKSCCGILEVLTGSNR